MLAPAALAAYLATCAPRVAPDTMRAIVAVESGGDPLALHDNTTRRSFSPRDSAHAAAVAHALIARGDSVDVGLAQVNSANFRGYRVDAARMLEPCANLTIASHILAGAYARSAAVAPTPRAALWGAISAYNTGSLFAGRPYVDAVVAQAIRTPTVPTIALLTASGTTAAPPLMPLFPPVSRAVVRLEPRRTAVRRARAMSAAEAPLVARNGSGMIRTLNGIDHGRS